LAQREQFSVASALAVMVKGLALRAEPSGTFQNSSKNQRRLIDMARDPEIIVSTGKMVGLFVVLVVVCALFFGFGYSMGRGAAVSAANGSSPAVVVLGQRTAAKVPPPTESSATSSTPSLPGDSTEPHAAPNGQYFLQVAAVTKQEDAEALVSALRKKDYAVFATNSLPAYKLFHVKIGPFSSQKDVEGLRAKLIAAGYNPIVKKQA
jgi:DedD protein